MSYGGLKIERNILTKMVPDAAGWAYKRTEKRQEDGERK